MEPKTNIIEQQKELASKAIEKHLANVDYQRNGWASIPMGDVVRLRSELDIIITQVITNIGEELNKRFMDLNGTVYADEVVVRARDIKNLIKEVTGVDGKLGSR